jgi:PPK2 family polyphosphate:nucleotide phosphotransferase
MRPVRPGSASSVPEDAAPPRRGNGRDMTDTDVRPEQDGGGRRRRVTEQLRVAPGTAAGLAGRDTAWTGGPDFAALSDAELSATAKELLALGVHDLTRAQRVLWASGERAVLLVFQAMDAAGKDSTIKHVMSGVNPQGVDVVSFGRPSDEELDHDFLWRVSKAVPARGRIGIFNRSHYEEVVALRVHPEWLDRQRLPAGPRGAEFWASRYEDINAFERRLDRSGTTVVKFFLHVSKAEQKRRFLSRLDEPGKAWKFNAADVDERALWSDYEDAFEAAITATSTPWAPWYVIPADHKPVMQAMVAAIVVDRIRELGLSYPEVPESQRAVHAEARRRLLAEDDGA